MKSQLSIRIISIVLLTAFVGITGCSSVKKTASRELVLEPRFVRSTVQNEFFGYRRINRMSPLLTDKMVIQGNAIDGLVAYDRKTGSEIWRLKIENGVEGGVEIAGSTLYFGGGDGMLRSVNAETGAVNWMVPVRAELLAPPTLESGFLFVQTGADVIYGLESGTGKLLWTYNRQVTSNLSVRATTRPVVSGDKLMVGFSDGFLVALRKRDGAVQWEKKLGKGNRFRDVDSTPVVSGDTAYVASFDGQLVAVKIENGDILWQTDLGGYLPVTVGEGAQADRLYFATIDGRVVELDQATGKEKRSFKLSRGIATQPLLYKGVLLFGESEGALRVIELDKLKTVAQYQTGDGLISTPTIDKANAEIWMVSSAATLYSMKLRYYKVAERFPWKRLESTPPSYSF